MFRVAGFIMPCSSLCAFFFVFGFIEREGEMKTRGGGKCESKGTDMGIITFMGEILLIHFFLLHHIVWLIIINIILG